MEDFITGEKIPIEYQDAKTGFMQFNFNVQTIIDRLDKVIELLESWPKPNIYNLRCKITGNICGTDTWVLGSPCKCENCRKLSPEEARKEYYPFFEPIERGKVNDAGSHNEGMSFCNCGTYKHGELTAGWHCPVHGQCF